MASKTVSGAFTINIIEDGMNYFMRTSNASATIPSNQESVAYSGTMYAYRRSGGDDSEAYSCYIIVWRKKGSTYTRWAYNTQKVTSYNFSSTVYHTGLSACDSIVVTMSDTLISTHAGYLAEIEIPVYKAGDKGNKGDKGDAAVVYELVPEYTSLKKASSQQILYVWIYKTVGGVRSQVSYGDISPTFTVSGATITGQWGQYDNDIRLAIAANSTAEVVLKMYIDNVEMARIGVPVIADGTNGKIGRNYYYAGEWEEIASSASFIVSDAQAPFFSYQPSGDTRKHYLFAPTTNGTYTKTQMGTPNPNTDSRWTLMWDDFEYLITKAIFGEFAKFGSAIINGDWMISTYGTIYIGGDADSYEVNATSSKTIGGVTYTKDNAYTLFDPEHPSGRASDTDSSVYNFVPNYAVDLLTGKTYQQNAYIYGEIRCKSLFKNVLLLNTEARYGSSSNPVIISGDRDLVFFAPNPYRYEDANNPNYLRFPHPWEYKGKEIQFNNCMPKKFTYTRSSSIYTANPQCNISMYNNIFYIDANNNIVDYDEEREERGEIWECYPRFKFLEDVVRNREWSYFNIFMSETTTGAEKDGSNTALFYNARSFKMLAAQTPTETGTEYAKTWYWYIYDVSYYLD